MSHNSSEHFEIRKRMSQYDSQIRSHKTLSRQIPSTGIMQTSISAKCTPRPNVLICHFRGSFPRRRVLFPLRGNFAACERSGYGVGHGCGKTSDRFSRRVFSARKKKTGDRQKVISMKLSSERVRYWIGRVCRPRGKSRPRNSPTTACEH